MLAFLYTPPKSNWVFETYPTRRRDRAPQQGALNPLLKIRKIVKTTTKFYSHSFNQAASDRLTMANEIRAALNNNELVLYYQPIIDIKQKRIVSAEALICWQPPGGDLIPLL